MRDFGYDISDYREVDPLFGSLQDFQALLKAAHDRNLKVIIDQVWSHTSSDHEWFQQSRQDRTNDKADWYVWADPKPDGSPPNNWQAWFGGPTWTWEPRRRQYYLHNFLPTQPDLNFRSEAVRTAILEVARYWLTMGVDGFRLDVANYYVHDAELRDNPPSGDPKPALPRNMQIHQFNSNQPETLDFIAKVRERVDGLGPNMTVGELAPGSYGLMAEYTKGQHRLHTAYAFDFLGAWPGVEKIAEHPLPVARRPGRWLAQLGLLQPRCRPRRLALERSHRLPRPARRTALRRAAALAPRHDLPLPRRRTRSPRCRRPVREAAGSMGHRTAGPLRKAATAVARRCRGRTKTLAGFTKAKEPWLPVDPRQRMIAAEKQEKLAGVDAAHHAHADRPPQDQRRTDGEARSASSEAAPTAIWCSTGKQRGERRTNPVRVQLHSHRNQPPVRCSAEASLVRKRRIGR